MSQIADSTKSPVTISVTHQPNKSTDLP